MENTAKSSALLWLRSTKAMPWNFYYLGVKALGQVPTLGFRRKGEGDDGRPVTPQDFDKVEFLHNFTQPLPQSVGPAKR